MQFIDVNPFAVSTYGDLGRPAAPKSFHTNDLRQIPSANTVPKDFQQNTTKDCSLGVDMDDE